MGEIHVTLLGGFDCSYEGERVALPLGAQRLLALLALHQGGIHRVTAGERLWPDSTRDRASANLRSALWRGRRIRDLTLIDQAGPRLKLAPTVRVDLHELVGWGSHIPDRARRLPSSGGWEVTVELLGWALLPDWPDDWLVLERERWNQLRLHSLEDLAQQLRAQEHFTAALQAALAAIAIEPIRETVHRLIIQVHLEQGNAASAVKHYQRYRAMLRQELGITPSPRMDQLIRPLMSH